MYYHYVFNQSKALRLLFTIPYLLHLDERTDTDLTTKMKSLRDTHKRTLRWHFVTLDLQGVECES